MSAYGHEMEREYTAQSLSSTGGSVVAEIGSRYRMETGIYMSSFAAMVFLSGLVTVAVSMMALLISLTVMLRSCENRNSGVLQMYNDIDPYGYCKTYAEFNSLDQDFFPETCKDFATRYVNGGQYMRDLNTTLGIADDFFGRLKPMNDSREIVLMDADDFFTSENLHSHILTRWINKEAFDDSNRVKNMFIVKLYLKVKAGGWPLILISRKPEKLRDAIIEHLASVGCSGWSSLIMRMENETQMDSQQHFSRQRTALQKEGIRVIATISSQMDAVRGACLGERIFKLPTPIFNDRMENYVESTNL